MQRCRGASLRAIIVNAIIAFAASGAVGVASAQQPIAIVDVTVIDGTGRPALAGMTVLLENGMISAVGESAAVAVPADARRIDGGGKHLLPGFIDSNVHASIYGNSTRRETVVKYGERNADLILEFLQRQLKHGVTTVRDSYGSLLPLMEVRDRIDRGEAIGARALVAGNIIGWGGPFSITFSLMQESELTLFQAMWNDSIAQGVGEELLDMGPEEVREAINAYLDKGPNFIKFGGTSHFRYPSLIGFAPRIQRLIVDETHKRGLIAETHSTSPEALRISVEAGVDLIQHPEILSRDYPEDLLRMIIDRGVLCAMRSNTLTGDVWRNHLLSRARAEQALRDAPPPRTSAERRQREAMLGTWYETERRNAERLIRAGCQVTIATDNYQGRAPEFRKQPKPVHQEAGIGSVLAIEGLVELGMTEMEAIVAATRNGALAAGMEDRIGTIETGKAADLLLLESNPLDNISNIRELSMVIARGIVIDLNALPEARIFSTDEPALFQPGVATPADGKATKNANPDAAAAAAPTTREPNRDSELMRRPEPDGAVAITNVRRTVFGKLVVTLAGGEVWRQLDSDNTRVVLPEDRSAMTATVEKTLLGGTRVRIVGTGRSFKASKVR